MLIQESENFEELYRNLDTIGGVQASNGKVYTPAQIKEFVNLVYQGRTSITAITNNYGLRDKVAELLDQYK